MRNCGVQVDQLARFAPVQRQVPVLLLDPSRKQIVWMIVTWMRIPVSKWLIATII